MAAVCRRSGARHFRPRMLPEHPEVHTPWGQSSPAWPPAPVGKRGASAGPPDSHGAKIKAAAPVPAPATVPFPATTPASRLRVGVPVALAPGKDSIRCGGPDIKMQSACARKQCPAQKTATANQPQESAPPGDTYHTHGPRSRVADPRLRVLGGAFGATGPGSQARRAFG